MNFSDIKIRQAGLCDIESIAKIKVTGFKSAYAGIIDGEYLDSMSAADQIENIKNYSLDNIFVAVKDKKILGFCRFYDYDKSVYEDKKIDCEIREIYVDPGIKRMGIGSKLFIHTLKHFQQMGKKKLYLGCLKENFDSRKFYEKMGGISETEGNIEISGKIYTIVSYEYKLND